MPTTCHMQDRGKTHTFSSHDSAEVRTPAPIITACFIVCSTCLTMKNALLVFLFVCLFCDKKGANRSHLSELTSQRHVSNIYSGELAGIFGLAMNIQYIHVLPRKPPYTHTHTWRKAGRDNLDVSNFGKMNKPKVSTYKD